MQKITKLSIILFLVIFITACGGSPKDKIVGKWTFVSLDGNTKLPKGFEDAYLEFRKEGTVDMHDGKKTQTAAYSFDKGNKAITLKFSGRDMNFTEFLFKDKDQIQFTWNKKTTLMKKK